MGDFPVPNTNNRLGAACKIRRNSESTSRWRFCLWCDGLVATETYFNRAADGFVHVPIYNVSVPRNLRYVFMCLTVTALFAASLLLGGDFVCGEIVWWRDKRISIVPWLGLANRRPLSGSIAPPLWSQGRGWSRRQLVHPDYKATFTVDFSSQSEKRHILALTWSEKDKLSLHVFLSRDTVLRLPHAHM